MKREGAMLRAFLWANALAVLAAFGSWATGGNYMFLRERPPTGSLLDHLGPWPIYILVGELLALILYWLLALPFGGTSLESRAGESSEHDARAEREESCHSGRPSQ